MNANNLTDWIGRKKSSQAHLEPLRAQALQATIDDPLARLEEGDALPPLWHWLYFWDVVQASGLGRDGHAALGEFLPPVALPRRMWAGSRLTFHKSPHLGEEIKKVSRIASLTEKEGRSGKLCFVTVAHRLERAEDLLVEEEHDIVYRSAPQQGEAPKAPKMAPDHSDWQREHRPDSVMLFRYSALTFNGHRIHYDINFCREIEGYPGLIVHGPLLATLMIDLARHHRPNAEVSKFSFRALSPLFADRPFIVHGSDKGEGQIDLWVANDQGQLAMAGEMTLSET